METSCGLRDTVSAAAVEPAKGLTSADSAAVSSRARALSVRCKPELAPTWDPDEAGAPGAFPRHCGRCAGAARGPLRRAALASLAAAMALAGLAIRSGLPGSGTGRELRGFLSPHRLLSAVGAGSRLSGTKDERVVTGGEEPRSLVVVPHADTETTAENREMEAGSRLSRTKDERVVTGGEEPRSLVVVPHADTETTAENREMKAVSRLPGTKGERVVNGGVVLPADTETTAENREMEAGSQLAGTKSDSVVTGGQEPRSLVVVPHADTETTAENIEMEVLLLGSQEDARAQGKRTLTFRSRASDKLGNALMSYWNARAIAFLEGLAFRWKGRRPLGAGIISLLPRYSPSGAPSAHLRELFRMLKDPGGPPLLCWTCFYPQASRYAPWHLFQEAMRHETLALVDRLEPQPGQDIAPPNTAVVHLRCDDEILGAGPEMPPGSPLHHSMAKSDYGLLPHRFVLDRLPSSVEHVVLVSKNDTFNRSSLCGKSAADLKLALETAKNVTVRLRSSSARSDWLYLATAPVLFCAPSTFCVTASFGNPHTVFVAVNGDSSAIVAPGQRLGPRWQLAPGALFHWVDTDYMPGTALWNMTWQALRRYLRSSRCEAGAGCLPCCFDKAPSAMKATARPLGDATVHFLQ